MSSNQQLAEGFRETEIGQLPDEWPVVTIGDLFDIQQGKALSHKNKTEGSKKPFLRTANVFWGYLDLTDLDQMFFTEDEAKRLHLQNGDLLICEGGDIGRTAMWRGEVSDCLHQNHVHRVRSKNPNVVPEFYMYWMQAAMLMFNLYSGEGNKTTIPNLSKSRLSSFSVPLPPKIDQQCITYTLNTVQSAREQTDAVIAATRELKKSLMKHLFTYGPTPPNQRDKIKLKTTDIGEMPEEWEIKSIGDIAHINKESRNPERIPADSFAYLDIAGVEGETGRIIDVKKILGKNAPSRARRVIHTNDVVLSTVRPYLKAFTLIPPELDNQICSTGYAVLTSKDIITPQYLLYLAYTDSVGSQFKQHMRGANYPAINPGHISSTKIPLPPISVQERIAATLSSVDKKTAVELNKKKALDDLFNTLLHDLMTAKLRVNHLEVPT